MSSSTFYSYYWCAECAKATEHKSLKGATWCAECGKLDRPEPNGTNDSERIE